MTPTNAPDSYRPDAAARRSIAFLNWAHGIDHFVLLIYPTVVIGLEVVYGRPYSELIALSSAAFIAFGVFSLPAGWIADHWSRRNMMALFYVGCGLSLVAAAFAPNLPMLAVADRKSTRLNSSHQKISYAVFCLKKKKSGRKTKEIKGKGMRTERNQAGSGSR